MFLISQFLSKRIKDIEKFRFIILTNKLIKTRSDQIETPLINEIKSDADIWDLDRIKRLYSGGWGTWYKRRTRTRGNSLPGYCRAWCQAHDP